MTTTKNVKYKKGQAITTRVRAWEVGRSKNKNTPFVRVRFDNYIDWTGWLTKDTKKRTLEVLELLGFKGANLGMLSKDDALNKEIEVAAVIDEIREYKGKFYHAASFINKISGGFTGDMPADLADMDTRGYITDAVDPDEDNYPASAGYGTDQGTTFTSEDIPF